MACVTCGKNRDMGEIIASVWEVREESIQALETKLTLKYLG
jgi:hypothetical protein